MNKTKMTKIKMQTLTHVLNQYFKKNIIVADYHTTTLHGGTVGNVNLVTGTAETEDGQKFPYQLVLKVQKQWERYNDPGSWRREYDLYMSDLEKHSRKPFAGPHVITRR